MNDKWSGSALWAVTRVAGEEPRPPLRLHKSTWCSPLCSAVMTNNLPVKNYIHKGTNYPHLTYDVSQSTVSSLSVHFLILFYGGIIFFRPSFISTVISHSAMCFLVYVTNLTINEWRQTLAFPELLLSFLSSMLELMMTHHHHLVPLLLTAITCWTVPP